MNYDEAEKDINDIVLNSDESMVLQDVVDYLYNHFEKYNWIGIYLVEGDNLILGPWNGKQATEHIKIPIGQGVCGSAAKSGKTEIVGDVLKDDRYLACFVSTRSEIVVPIISDGIVVGEIDIDSDVNNAFDRQDSVFLEKVADMIKNFC